MTEPVFKKLPFFLYRHERQILHDPPTHQDLEPRSICPSIMMIDGVEYMGNAYVRVRGHCQRHQDELYWIADYVNAE